ncbi:MAG TPA: HD domain-containing protein [Anaerolineales bacterium]|nr:HD domain-containing protein [Anaerolineales bacterium]
MLSLENARSWYSASDPVHGFDHVARVYQMAVRLAQIEGADIEIVKAAALLHDAGIEADRESAAKLPPETRASHHHAAAEFAKTVLGEEGWSEERIAAVQHCIRSHRFRDESEHPQTLEAKILFDADKLDAIGAIGVARAIGYAVQARQPTYARASEQFKRSGLGETGEAHSAYHEYIFKLRWLNNRLYTPSARKIGVERHRVMEAYFVRLAAEWDGEG